MQTRRGLLAGLIAGVVAAIAGVANRPEAAAEATVELVAAEGWDGNTWDGSTVEIVAGSDRGRSMVITDDVRTDYIEMEAEYEVEQLPDGYAAVYVGGTKWSAPVEGTLVSLTYFDGQDWHVVPIAD